ncbi:MAG TPA: PqiC family protein [Steroidobacteraceae bacterium]|nr:PqiC family protein [Steroidobacteraceae bacterium]
MKPHASYALAASLLGLLGACGSSPPTRYFTLTSLPASAAASPSDAPPVRIARVSLPAELDRQQLVRHVGADRVDILEQDLWAGPLDELVLRTLSSDLAARLPPGLVADPAEPVTDAPRRLLYLQFVRLAADDSCAIDLQVDWTLQTPGSEPQRGTERFTVSPHGSCPDAIPAGISRGLAELSERLVRHLEPAR